MYTYIEEQASTLASAAAFSAAAFSAAAFSAAAAAAAAASFFLASARGRRGGGMPRGFVVQKKKQEALNASFKVLILCLRH